VARIKSSRESLEQSFHRISEAIYRQAGAGAGTAGGSDFGGEQGNPTDESAPRDDTIEGEYKEM
jgi:molecular chaperone DnaK